MVRALSIHAMRVASTFDYLRPPDLTAGTEDERAATVMACASCEGSAQSTARPGAPMILVVDDNNDIREMVAEALAQHGYRVSTAPDGQAAFDQALADPPDLIVLDLMMPVMTGWQFMEQQRGDPRLARIPVIIVTAFSDSHPEGAAAFMRKPFGLDTLLTTVARICDGAPEPSLRGTSNPV
jgi:two-component system, chemotaxis family, chemotaxis protein CheY